MAISPFVWSGNSAMPWDKYQEQQAAQFQPVQSPLQGLGMLAQAYATRMRSDPGSYFQGVDGGWTYDPLAQFRSGGGLY